MKGVAVALLALGLCASGALAATGEPQHEFTKAGQARAVRASLQQSDLPPGWVGQPKDKQSANDADPRCSYYNPDQSDLVEIGKYDSRDFKRADGATISTSTGVFRTVKMAETGYGRVAQPALAKCLAELFKKGTRPSLTTVFSAARLQFPSYGDRSDAFRIVASVKAPTARVRVYLDVFLFNRGAVDVAVLALGLNRPLPLQVEQSLVGKLAQRAQ